MVWLIYVCIWAVRVQRPGFLFSYYTSQSEWHSRGPCDYRGDGSELFSFLWWAYFSQLLWWKYTLVSSYTTPIVIAKRRQMIHSFSPSVSFKFKCGQVLSLSHQLHFSRQATVVAPASGSGDPPLSKQKIQPWERLATGNQQWSLYLGSSNPGKSNAPLVCQRRRISLKKIKLNLSFPLKVIWVRSLRDKRC